VAIQSQSNIWQSFKYALDSVVVGLVIFLNQLFHQVIIGKLVEVINKFAMAGLCFYNPIRILGWAVICFPVQV